MRLTDAAEILGTVKGQRIVLGRAVVTEMEILRHPDRRGLEVMLVRRYERLIDQMDDAERTPDWLMLQRARQGSE